MDNGNKGGRQRGRGRIVSEWPVRKRFIGNPRPDTAKASEEAEALPVGSNGQPMGGQPPCLTITGFDCALGAEWRQRPSPKAEPLVKNTLPRNAPGHSILLLPRNHRSR